MFHSLQTVFMWDAGVKRLNVHGEDDLVLTCKLKITENMKSMRGIFDEGGKGLDKRREQLVKIFGDLFSRAVASRNNGTTRYFRFVDLRQEVETWSSGV
jgi:hypothetical protein